MPVTKSSWLLGTKRPDGLIPCVETIETQHGTGTRKYAAPEGTDWAGHLAETVADVKIILADNEFDRILTVDGPIVLKDQSLAQLLARFRNKYRGANRAVAAAMAVWLTRRLAAGHITATAFATAFNLSTPEKATAFKARLDQQAAAWLGFLTALGEVPNTAP